LEEIPTTEEWERIEALRKQVFGDELTDKLSLLRQKLSQKAKQETEVPVLRFVRPDLSERCAEGRMGTGASQ